MKAHVKKTEKTVLIYGLLPQEFTDVKRVLLEQGVKVERVQNDQLHWQVGALAGFAGFQSFQPVENTPLDSPVLLFAGCDSKSIDQVLDTLRTTDVKIPLKAVVTATNQRWTFMQLAKELAREHEAVMSRRTIKNTANPQ